MNKFLSFLGMIALLVALQACGDDFGIVQGKVVFQGLPCQTGQPDFKVPPCSGAYPKYEIEVYSDKLPEQPVTTSMSDEQGNFKIILPPGNYFIKTQKGAQLYENNEFSIQKDKTTALNLTVSTGIM